MCIQAPRNLRSSAVELQDVMEEVGATLGETQRFECQVIGFPTPTIRWFKDEVDITNNERYHVDYEQEMGVITLVIRNVTLADEGLYQCRAENSEGYATTTAYLVVKGAHSSLYSMTLCTSSRYGLHPVWLSVQPTSETRIHSRILD